MSSELLLQARTRYARRAWGDAHAGYTAVAAETALGLDDLECYAIVSHLIGRNDESRDILAQGYREAVRAGASAHAARFAFWLGHGLMFEGRTSESSGWFARARQLIADQESECPEHGYLLIPQGVEQLEAGRWETAGRVLFGLDPASPLV